LSLGAEAYNIYGAGDDQISQSTKIIREGQIIKFHSFEELFHRKERDVKEKICVMGRTRP
jgi:hypothetical protein